MAERAGWDAGWIPNDDGDLIAANFWRGEHDHAHLNDFGIRSSIVATAILTGADRDMRTGWDVPDAWHWRLADVVVLDPPRPMRGAQGLWEVTP
jgi:hypothetical protein